MSLPSLSIGDLTAKLPIIQGGMGVGISLHKLAAAVSSQGGIGVIAAALVGMKEPDLIKNPGEANGRALAKEIQQVRELSSGVLGVNIMVVLNDFSSLARSAISSKADIIFSGAGLPLELPKHLLNLCEEKKEEFKTKLVPIVSSARAASIICKKWLARFGYLPDAFVVEGPKAGGHLGFRPEDIENEALSLELLIPQVVDAVKEFEDKHGKKIPTIAAGGIYTGGDIAQIMEKGAAGVQMGTRFVATEECDASLGFKEAFINAKEEDIVLIKSPVGLPGRAIKSRFLEALETGKKNFRCAFHCISTCDPKTSPYCIANALISAMRGNFDRGFAFSGTNGFKIDKIISVKELMQNLQDEFMAEKQKILAAKNNSL